MIMHCGNFLCEDVSNPNQTKKPKVSRFKIQTKRLQLYLKSLYEMCMSNVLSSKLFALVLMSTKEYQEYLPHLENGFCSR